MSKVNLKPRQSADGSTTDTEAAEGSVFTLGNTLIGASAIAAITGGVFFHKRGKKIKTLEAKLLENQTVS